METRVDNAHVTIHTNTAKPIDSIFSTANGGCSAYIYKVSCGYKVDITRQDKTCVYYCKSESDCYNVITNATK